MHPYSGFVIDLDFVIKFVDYYVREDGTILGYEKDKYSTDDLSESRVLFDLYKYTKNEKYLKAIHMCYEQVKTHPRTKEGNFWHKKIYPNQIWLDGMYMYVPFLARCAKTFDQSELFKEIRLQYQYIRENMYDEDKKKYIAWDGNRRLTALKILQNPKILDVLSNFTYTQRNFIKRIIINLLMHIIYFVSLSICEIR